MCFFAIFVALLVIFLNFLGCSLPKFSQRIDRILRNLNTKEVLFVKVVFLWFLQIYVFCRCEKNWSHRLTWKTSPHQCQTFTTSLPNFTEFHRSKPRKFTVSFAFCARVGVIKYRKTLTFSFERAEITWAFVLSARAIVKLQRTNLDVFERWNCNLAILQSIRTKLKSSDSNESCYTLPYWMSLILCQIQAEIILVKIPLIL